jgi:hypothetical protein
MTLEAASVRLAAEIDLASVLADSEDGLSVQEIAETTGVDGLKLGAFVLLPKSLVYVLIIPQSVLSGF